MCQECVDRPTKRPSKLIVGGAKHTCRDKHRQGTITTSAACRPNHSLALFVRALAWWQPTNTLSRPVKTRARAVPAYRARIRNLHCYPNIVTHSHNQRGKSTRTTPTHIDAACAHGDSFSWMKRRMGRMNGWMCECVSVNFGKQQ